jgi:hypothetical protein
MNAAATAAAANYTATGATVTFHALPHYNFAFKAVSNAFRPSSAPYLVGPPLLNRL